MKVCLKKSGDFPKKEEVSVVKKFLQFLQSQVPLNKKIQITFTDAREVPMTTGVRMPGNEIFVLAKGRLLIDILRTISHEWIHEFQSQKMGVKDNVKIQDIGGPEENMCNILSGVLKLTYDEFVELLDELENLLKKKDDYISDEMDEIERAVQDLSRDGLLETTVQDVVRAFTKAKEIIIPKDVWLKLENTESNQVKKGEMKKVIAIAKQYNKTSPLELKKALVKDEYNPPLILKFGDRYHLVAGNTRLSTAAALGMSPRVIIAEV